MTPREQNIMEFLVNHGAPRPTLEPIRVNNPGGIWEFTQATFSSINAPRPFATTWDMIIRHHNPGSGGTRDVLTELSSAGFPNIRIAPGDLASQTWPLPPVLRETFATPAARIIRVELRHRRLNCQRFLYSWRVADLLHDGGPDIDPVRSIKTASRRSPAIHARAAG